LAIVAKEAVLVAQWYADHVDSETAKGFTFAYAAAQTALKTFPGMFVKDSAIGFRRVHTNQFPYVEWYWVDDESHQVFVLALTHNRQSDHAIRESIEAGRAQSGVPGQGHLPRLTTQQTAELLRQRLAQATDHPESAFDE
jgi:hypothetical protein